MEIQVLEIIYTYPDIIEEKINVLSNSQGTETIDEIKDKLEVERGYRPLRHELSYRGTTLLDHCILNDEKIKNGCRIIWSSKLTGGK